jgi:hypothetical protein
MKVVMIGAVAAGTSAATEIRRRDKTGTPAYRPLHWVPPQTKQESSQGIMM